MTTAYSSVVKGFGSYLPEKIVSNYDLEKQIETSHDWIFTRTGINQRHIAAKDETSSDMAYKASLNAINDAKIQSDDIDLIIVATTTPDLTFPATAVLLQKKLEIQGAAFDVQAVCAGFVYALNIADNFIKSGQCKSILVVGVDKMSSIVNWQDRSTAVLFGDGAGAVILQAGEVGKGILNININSDGRYSDILNTCSGVATNGASGFVQMQGQEVFRHAVAKMTQSVKKSLINAGLEISDVDFLVPHQANQRIIERVGKKLNIDSNKVISTVADTANTSAASIPIALDRAKDKFKENSIIALTAIGGGLSWGSALIRK